MPKSPPDRPLRLAEIAVAAGVSIPTVSKVINHRTDVAPATRERVQRVIDASGFAVNRAGRALRTGRSKQIDFVVQGLYSYHAFLVLRGIEEALASTDISTVLASTHDHLQRERRWVQRLGNVLAYTQRSHRQLEFRRGAPEGLSRR